MPNITWTPINMAGIAFVRSKFLEEVLDRNALTVQMAMNSNNR